MVPFVNDPIERAAIQAEADGNPCVIYALAMRGMMSPSRVIIAGAANALTHRTHPYAGRDDGPSQRRQLLQEWLFDLRVFRHRLRQTNSGSG